MKKSTNPFLHRKTRLGKGNPLSTASFTKKAGLSTKKKSSSVLFSTLFGGKKKKGLF